MDANDTLLAHLFVGKTTPGFLSSVTCALLIPTMSMSHKGIFNPSLTKAHGLGKIGRFSVYNTRDCYTTAHRFAGRRRSSSVSMQTVYGRCSSLHPLPPKQQRLTRFSQLSVSWTQMISLKRRRTLAEYGLDTPQSTMFCCAERWHNGNPAYWERGGG